MPPPSPPLMPSPLEPVPNNAANAARWRAAIGSIAVILAGVLGYQVAPFGETKPVAAPLPCSCECIFVPESVAPSATAEVTP